MGISRDWKRDSRVYMIQQSSFLAFVVAIPCERDRVSSSTDRRMMNETELTISAKLEG